MTIGRAAQRRLGIQLSYHDAFGRARDVDRDVVEAITRIMGGADDASDRPDPVRIARRGSVLPPGAEVELEDGTGLGRLSRLPRDLPFGYHRLRSETGSQLLIVGPGRCHLPPSLRAWGWAVQLYAARSRESWGIGDLADLRALGAWGRREGAEVLVVNPLHAATPTRHQQASPYYPATRRFRNPLYLRIEEVPGARDAIGHRLDELARAGRALNGERLVDRDAAWALKREALEAIWRAREPGPDFARYRELAGTALESWARFSIIAERHGPAWQAWPAELRRPESPAVGEVAAADPDRVAFHAWMQWLLDEQLAAAARTIPIVSDMPVGVDPSGADGWAWQGLLASGASVGAPPDRFNTRGQDWGLPPFVPHRLRAAGYGPFIETIRASLRHAGGLRIDHVMGLFRLWWIPGGAEPAAGAYVTYPADELLEIVALESWRAGALVIGEDLGTVEPHVREKLAALGVLSSRLLWFEEGPPEGWPAQALGSVTTHDLPTIAGAWSGTDAGDQSRIGLEVDPAEMTTLIGRLESATGLPPTAGTDDVIAATHRRLAAAPCMLVTATLEDALAVHERPNMPGTVDQWPNWSISLPMPIDDLPRHGLARRVAAAMREGRATAVTERADDPADSIADPTG